MTVAAAGGNDCHGCVERVVGPDHIADTITSRMPEASRGRERLLCFGHPDVSKDVAAAVRHFRSSCKLVDLRRALPRQTSPSLPHRPGDCEHQRRHSDGRPKLVKPASAPSAAGDLAVWLRYIAAQPAHLELEPIEPVFQGAYFLVGHVAIMLAAAAAGNARQGSNPESFATMGGEREAEQCVASFSTHCLAWPSSLPAGRGGGPCAGYSR